MNFDQLGLSEPLLRALRDEGYASATPIQEQAIPPVLKGRDLLGCAQTGTGKTAAFALPILHRLSLHAPAHAPVPARPASAAGQHPHSYQAHHHQPVARPIRVLVLTPTRELAAQIDESFRAYGRHLKLTTTVIFGGVGQHPQVQALRRGVDILVATPGRLLDLMNQGYIRFPQLEVLVLDEADRMLDMGFINDIRKVLAVIPKQRQTLFFSATMPREIRSLADNILREPVEVSVTPVATTAETVTQGVYFVAKPDKPALLEHLLADKNIRRMLVFTRTKHGADKVARHLEHANIKAEAIHGNKSQNARTRALDNFKKGSTRVLVASDIAARGLDIDEISHVVNFDVPNEPETYVHRIGRTGRAGASGIALSFCDGEERAFLRDIERIIRKPVPVIADHPFVGRVHAPRPPAAHSQGHGGRQQHGGGQSRGGPRFGGRQDGHRHDSRQDAHGQQRPAQAADAGAAADRPAIARPAQAAGRDVWPSRRGGSRRAQW